MINLLYAYHPKSICKMATVSYHLQLDSSRKDIVVKQTRSVVPKARIMGMEKNSRVVKHISPVTRQNFNDVLSVKNAS